MDPVTNFIQQAPVLALFVITFVTMMVLLFGSLLIVRIIGKMRRGMSQSWYTVPYFLGILLPLLWLLAPYILSRAAVTTVSWDYWLRQVYYALRLGVEDWFMLPAGLLFLVFACYVLVGDRSEGYQDVIKRRKSVWLVFGLVVLFVTWFVPNTLMSAQAKFSGVHVDLTFDISEAIKDMRTEASRLLVRDNTGAFVVNDTNRKALLDKTDALSSTLSRLQDSMWADSELLGGPSQATDRMVAAMAEAMAQDLSKESASISASLDQVAAAATDAQNTTNRLAVAATAARAENVAQQAKALQQQIEEEVRPQIKAAKQKVEALTSGVAVTTTVQDAQQALAILQQTIGTAAEPPAGSVAHAANLLAKAVIAVGPNTKFDAPSREVVLGTISQMQALVNDIRTLADPLAPNSGQDWRVNAVQDKAHALELAAAGLAFDTSTPLLMVALVFVVFLLMPWLLYISFIIYKREQIVNDNRDLLRDLCLLKRFRTAASLSNDPIAKDANKARELVLADPWKPPSDPEHKAEHKGKSPEYKGKSLAYERVFKMTKQPTQAQKKEIERLVDTELLSLQAFYSREYLIPLLILTALTLVGWYYIVFAAGSNGLVGFIEQGGTSLQLANLLNQFTPFTMVFAGAWLFMLIMLTYRWVSNDLTPQSYFYASTRMVYGLLVGMVFLALFGNQTSWYWLLLAFFVGTAPLEFVIALWRWLKQLKSWQKKDHASQIVTYFERPDWVSQQPLTDLEDITVWDDTRFYQEGIQNVHALATADLMRLAIRTPYAGQTLVDWVDQAVLRIHTKVLWHAGMSAIGIRGATDLFDSCADEQGKWSGEKLTHFVNAFNTAQLMSIGTGDARFGAYNEAAALETAGQTLADAAKAAKDAGAKLDPTKPETLDNIIALRNQVKKVRDSADAAVKTRQLIGVLAGLNAADVATSWMDGGELDTQLKALADGTDNLIEKAENVVEENKITSKQLEKDRAKAANDDKPGQKALEEAQAAVKNLVGPANNIKKAAETAAPQLNQIKKVIKPVKAKVDVLQGYMTELGNQVAQAGTFKNDISPANHNKTVGALNEALTLAKTAGSAAADLVKAAAGSGEAFKVINTDATLLQTALDTVHNQITEAQTAIANMKVENADSVGKAKSAVDNVVTLVGAAESPDENTTAGKMNAIAKWFQDAETQLETAIATIGDLATAITLANTLAQSIKKDDPTTWDNVKALASTLSKLTKAVEGVETARSSAEKKLDGLNVQQTLALREAQKKVKELSTADAKSKAEAAEKAFEGGAESKVEVTGTATTNAAGPEQAPNGDANKALSAASDREKIKAAKAKVEPAVTAAETLASDAEATAEEAMRTVLPLRLTKEILEVMLAALERDPNIHYLRCYWNRQGNKIKKCAKKTQQAKATA